MFWVEKAADEIEKAHPKGELIVSSGVSPSGKYHVGTLREVLTTDALALELQRRGREVRHIHFSDDLDPFRKVPAGIDPSFEKYFGKSLCDVPSPDGNQKSYADYYLADFLPNLELLGIEMEVVRSHEKYRSGYFMPAIEKVLQNLDTVRECIYDVSGRELASDWSPIQINEDGYLKKREFVSLDEQSKTLTYIDKTGEQASVKYDNGLVKLDWRLDWPARWWLVGVDAEPFGRDHATKGGSYDTGSVLVDKIFGGKAPYPVPYDFINRAGENKKMSKSAGNTVTITELLEVLPPEIVRFFVLRYSADKMLVFDQQEGVVRLIDEFAELIAKPEKTSEDEALIYLCTARIKNITVSNVPFSHLVASYQSALRDPQMTIDIIKRTEHADVAGEQEEIIINELAYIDKWLDKWAPESVKFSLRESVSVEDFNEAQLSFLKELAQKIAAAPENADGQWFHNAIYELKTDAMPPKMLFEAIYMCLIGQNAGPRAGWFLSILPREWLLNRLRFLG